MENVEREMRDGRSEWRLEGVNEWRQRYRMERKSEYVSGDGSYWRNGVSCANAWMLLER